MTAPAPRTDQVPAAQAARHQTTTSSTSPSLPTPAPTQNTTAGRRHRFALVAALYSSQNLCLGFFTYAFLTIAQERGVPLAAIGTAAGVATVLTLKFIWAPVVDRFGSARLGHYRGWLLGTQLALGVGTALLATLDPATNFSALLAVFAVLFVIAGTQDIAADAAATRLLRPNERGIGNGFQSAGASVAQVVGGGVMLVVYQAAGWQVAALVLAVFSLIPLPFILSWKEQIDTAAQPTPRITLRSAFAFFRIAAVRWWCLLLIPSYTVGFTIAYNLVRPLLVDAGWAAGRIGFTVVIGGSAVGIVCGIAAGWLVSRIGRKPALIWLGALQVVATLGVVPLALGFTAEWFVFIVVALANGAFSAAFAIVYTISMDLARPESAGTDFTYFTTIGSIMMVIAGGGAMVAAGVFGYVPVLVCAGALALAGLAVTVWQIDRVLVTATR